MTNKVCTVLVTIYEHFHRIVFICCTMSEYFKCNNYNIITINCTYFCRSGINMFIEFLEKNYFKKTFFKIYIIYIFSLSIFMIYLYYFVSIY